MLAREQFLPHEMRIVAALRMQGASDEQVIVRVKSENLFQYLTERMVANRATVCLRRLDAMVPTDAVCAARGIDPKTAVEAASSLTRLMASGTPTQADQAIFYSMICRYDIVRELVLVEVGERLQNFDYAFTAVDLNAFMTRFTTEYPDAARWTEPRSSALRARSARRSAMPALSARARARSPSACHHSSSIPMSSEPWFSWASSRLSRPLPAGR